MSRAGRERWTVEHNRYKHTGVDEVLVTSYETWGPNGEPGHLGGFAATINTDVLDRLVGDKFGKATTFKVHDLRSVWPAPDPADCQVWPGLYGRWYYRSDQFAAGRGCIYGDPADTTPFAEQQALYWHAKDKGWA